MKSQYVSLPSLASSEGEEEKPDRRVQSGGKDEVRTENVQKYYLQWVCKNITYNELRLIFQGCKWWLDSEAGSKDLLGRT